MDVEQLFKDIAFIQDHINMQPNERMKLWVGNETDDYQLPSAAIIRFLTSAIFKDKENCIQIKDSAVHRAIVNIVANSSLHAILIYSEKEKCVKYRDEVQDSLIEQIGTFLDSRGNVIAN